MTTALTDGVSFIAAAQGTGPFTFGGPGAHPNTLLADGTVLTPINPVPTNQYGPSHWGSNVMLRQDDRPQYIYTEKPDAS